MTSPTPPKSAGHDASMYRFVTPAVQVLAASVILFTGAGISAIFWKMPTNDEFYDLCQTEIVDKKMTAVPLPSEMVAAISQEEMQQISLPTLNIAPVVDSGEEKYAKDYKEPNSLAAAQTEQAETPILKEKDEPLAESSAPKKFEPMRHIVEKKPMILESVDNNFATKPESVSTAEKSDELLSVFHFAENGKADLAASAVPEPPTDPFPATVPDNSSLQPLQLLQLTDLTPLLPLEEGGLQPLETLTPE